MFTLVVVWVEVSDICGAGRTWWRLVQSTYLGDCPLEKILWEEFSQVIYKQFFSSAIIEEKRQEFMALT